MARLMADFISCGSITPLRKRRARIPARDAQVFWVFLFPYTCIYDHSLMCLYSQTTSDLHSSLAYLILYCFLCLELVQDEDRVAIDIRT